MQIPSTGTILDAFQRLTRPADVRPPETAPPARADSSPPGAAARTDTRTALAAPEPAETAPRDLSRPPGDGPFRRGSLVDIRV